MERILTQINSFLQAGTKTCLIICGPTASGKTSLAIELAQHFNTEIISADSRQCFTELNIGVAKPTAEELHTVPHHFINSHSIHDDVTAAVFEQYALQAVEKIFENNNVAVMAGGTGLYIKAFCEGLDEIPAVAEEIREDIRIQYEKKGIAWLEQQLKEKDHTFYKTGEMQNPRRMMRALEVILATGKSITGYKSSVKKERPFQVIKTGIDVPRETLYSRINRRVDDMMKAGLEQEAKALYPFKNLNALQTVGYTELFDYFEGKTTRQRAIELIKQNTRHYAKRQMTWFKKDTSIFWTEQGK